MFRDLLPLLVVLALAAVVYVLRERRRKRMQVNPPLPGLSMREAWELWLSGMRDNSDVPFLGGGMEPLSDDGRAQAEKDLLETERMCLQSEHPRRSLRYAILANATTALYLEAISELGEVERQALLKGYAEGMDDLLRSALRTSTLKWVILRQYARIKYDDAIVDDWFHRFMHLARPYIREKVRLARQFLLELDEGAGRFAAIYDTLLAELQQESLKPPPKQRFVPPDLAWGRTGNR